MNKTRYQKKKSWYQRKKLSQKLKERWTPEMRAEQSVKIKKMWESKKLNGTSKRAVRSEETESTVPSITAVIIEGKKFVSLESVITIIRAI